MFTYHRSIIIYFIKMCDDIYLFVVFIFFIFSNYSEFFTYGKNITLVRVIIYMSSMLRCRIARSCAKTLEFLFEGVDALPVYSFLL